MQFQRDGNYPDANTPQTPWGGQPFPLVKNTGGPFFAPFFALSSDFGLDRWTFSVGVFGPSSVGNRTYPLSVGGLPSPARYDLVQALPILVLPTAAVAVRVARWLDVGVALHVAVAKFDLTSVSFTDISRGVCPNPEYQPCDATNKLSTSGATATAALGLLLRPVRWWALGVNVRGPIHLDTSGTVTAQAPAALPMKIDPAPATFATNLPWVLRMGTRFILVKDADFETADLELDATWENWGGAQADGPHVNIPNLSLFSDIHPTIVHRYRDTFSVRLGASYTARLPAGALSFRIGGYYDSSATAPKDTRVDFDTLSKLAATVGIGYAVKGFAINLAYAYVYELDRVVSDGEIRPVNGAAHGEPVDDQGNPLPPVNNGRYHAQTHILSIGVSFRFDELAGHEHRPRWPVEEVATLPTRPRPRVVDSSEEHDESDDSATATQTATATRTATAADGGVETYAPETISHPKKKKLSPAARRRMRTHVRGRRLGR